MQYTNYSEVVKMFNFSIETNLIFTKAVLTSTHNLCFGIKNNKMYAPVFHSFTIRGSFKKFYHSLYFSVSVVAIYFKIFLSASPFLWVLSHIKMLYCSW